MWLRQNAAESQQAVARYLCFDGLVMRWLGSEGLIEHSLAARTMGFDIVRKEWAPEVLAAAGLDPNLMPPAQPPATVVGGVARGVAHELGLKPATPIVTGAHDWVCAVAASGVQPGRRQATDIMGSLEGLLVPTRGPFLQAAARAQGYSTYCGPSSETYVTMGFIPTAGVLLQWCKDTLAEGEAGHGPAAGRDPFGLMVSAALRAKAGVTVIPHFSGRGTPDFEPAMRGRIYGLSLDTTRAEIVRGVVEGLCCELRHNLEVLDGLGLTLDELHCVGGGARSNEWLQLKADITGKAVSAHDNVEGSCTGAAIFAGLGVGLLDSAGSAAQTWGGPPRRFAPSASRRPEMDQLYAGYLKLRQGLG